MRKREVCKRRGRGGVVILVQIPKHTGGLGVPKIAKHVSANEPLKTLILQLPRANESRINGVKWLPHDEINSELSIIGGALNNCHATLRGDCKNLQMESVEMKN